MGNEFLDSLDIANRVCQHCGVNQILSVTEDTTNNNEISLAYGKLRRAELRRNAWRFAIRKTVLRPITSTTLAITPAAWASGTTYLFGALVTDTNGAIWISMIAENLGNSPGGNNTAWDAYFGPAVCDLWTLPSSNVVIWSNTTTYVSGQQVQGSDGFIYTLVVGSNMGTNPVGDGGVHWLNTGLRNSSSAGYYAGELAYVQTGAADSGSYQVYMSLTNYNVDTPGTGTTWSATQQYNQDQIVTYSSTVYISLTPVNIGNVPGSSAGIWAVYSGTNADVNWLPVNVTLSDLFMIWPLGAGYTAQTTTRNAYPLPSGYVGPAPQNPKQGIMTFLGGPTGNNQPDWEFDDGFIVTTWSQPIIFRFVADITNVKKMDDMFCEGLAARTAIAVCKRLTGSTDLVAGIAQQYKLFMSEARIKNGIETGTTEPYEDEYVTIRV